MNEKNWILTRNGTEVNRIYATEEFTAAYCIEHGLSYQAGPEIPPDPEPSPEVIHPSPYDTLRADVDYLLMMEDE